MDDQLVAFLRAMADHPEDAVTPLVFADWLDDRHDRRAGYVRLAHAWLLADRAVAADPSPDALAECYLAMSRAKVAYTGLLNTVLQPYRNRGMSCTTLCGFAESLEVQPAHLPPLLEHATAAALRKLSLVVPPDYSIPAAAREAVFSGVESVRVTPVFPNTSTVRGRRIDSAELIGWLSGPAFPQLSTVQLQVASEYGRVNLSLEWFAQLDIPPEWVTKTVGILPPKHDRSRREVVAEMWDRLTVSAVGRLVSPFNLEMFRPGNGMPPWSEELIVPCPLPAAYFFRCTSDVHREKSWYAFAESSPATQLAIDTATGWRRGQRERDESRAAAVPDEDTADLRGERRAQRKSRREPP